MGSCCSRTQIITLPSVRRRRLPRELAVADARGVAAADAGVAVLAVALEAPGEAVRAVAREQFGRSHTERHDEGVRRRLSGRRGSNRADPRRSGSGGGSGPGHGPGHGPGPRQYGGYYY